MLEAQRCVEGGTKWLPCIIELLDVAQKQTVQLCCIKLQWILCMVAPPAEKALKGAFQALSVPGCVLQGQKS